MAAVDDEIVSLGLAANGFINGIVQKFVAFRCAQGRAQVSGILLTKAHIECPGTGQANAIAALAEIVGHWRDESDATTGFLHLDIAGGTTGLVADIFQSELFAEFGPQQ